MLFVSQAVSYIIKLNLQSEFNMKEVCNNHTVIVINMLPNVIEMIM